jgi:hypothetical protein
MGGKNLLEFHFLMGIVGSEKQPHADTVLEKGNPYKPEGADSGAPFIVAQEFLDRVLQAVHTRIHRALRYP